MHNNSVYWIHRAGHTDIHRQGYVGVSCNVPSRIKQHKHNNTVVGKALRKHDDIIVDVVQADLSLSEALDLEKDLRPTELVGWNLCAGGGVPISQRGKSKKYTNQGLVGELRTDRQKAASAKKSRDMKGCISPNKGKSMSNEQKQKLSNKLKGRAKGPHSEERKAKLSVAALNRLKSPCPGCGQYVSNSTLARYHKGCTNGA